GSLYVDHPRLRLGRLLQRQTKDAVFQLGLRFVRVYFHGQSEGARELNWKPLATANGVARRNVRRALSRDGQHVVVYRDLQLILRDAWNLGDERQLLTFITQAHGRSAKGPCRGFILLEETINLAAEVIHPAKTSSKVTPIAQHICLPRIGL